MTNRCQTPERTVTDTAGGRRLVQIGWLKDDKFVPLANVNFYPKAEPVYREDKP